MRKSIIWVLGCVMSVFVLSLSSCTKMDYHYKDLIIERTYIGKPDSVWVQPGNQRVKLGIKTPKDPAASKLIVRYNSGDSIMLNLDRNAPTNSIIIDNLEERDYVFTVFTVDDSGNRSLMTEISSPVYGFGFSSSMREREYTHSVGFSQAMAVVAPLANLYPETYLGDEVEYTDLDGQVQKLFVSRDEFVGMLDHVDKTVPVSIRSAYKPHEHAFENFYTDPIIMDLRNAVRNTLTFTSDGYLDAAYVDFRFVQTFLEANVPLPKGNDIDICYALGAGSRGNMFTMDGTGFSAFSSAWQATIDAWQVRNTGQLKLTRGAAALAVYDQLDETNRTQMIETFESATATAGTRISSLAVDDVILLASTDREIYVAMKVTQTPPAVSGAPGNFSVEFKVSRP